MASWEFIYYSVAAACCFTYLAGIWVFNLPILTFSSVNFFLAFLLAILPGYGATEGRFLPVSLQRGFDQTIYSIYLAYAVTLTAAALVGQVLARRYAIAGSTRPKLNARVGLIVVFILIYGCAYFQWVPYVPLRNLLSGSANLASVAEQRISITHQLGEMEAGVPLPFRYWRTVLQFWSVIMCYYLVYGNNSGARLSRTVSALCISATAFLVMFTLEKILIVQFVFGLLVIRSLMMRRAKLGRLALAGIACLLLSMTTIAVFMGGEMGDLFAALTNRINEQTSSTYVQIEYVREHGFLGVRGVKFPMSSWFVDPGYFVDLGREAYIVIFPERSAAGFVGSAAGLSLADLYFAFGWAALPVFAIMVALHSWIDIAWRNGLRQERVSLAFRRINGAFYAFGMSILNLTFLSSVFLILSPPFGLSAQSMLLALPYIFLVKVTSLRILKLP